MALEKPQLQVVATVATHEASIWKTTGKKTKTVLPHFNTPPGCYEINTLYVQISNLAKLKGASQWKMWFITVIHIILLGFCGFTMESIFLDFFVSKANGRQCSLGFPQRPKCQTSAWDLASALWQPLVYFALCQVESTEVFGFVLEVRAFQFGERFFLETVGFQKRRYLYKKNMACELHWNLLDMRELIEILLITSNGFEILWFEQFFFLGSLQKHKGQDDKWPPLSNSNESKSTRWNHPAFGGTSRTPNHFIFRWPALEINIPWEYPCSTMSVESENE